MSDRTKIEWTDATWNVVNGCSVTSPGCTNCYAMRLAGTRLKHHPGRAGLTREVNGNHVWTGETRFNHKVLLDPLRWKRPRRIFVCAHGDLFHDSVPDEWIDRVFAVMALAPQHQFQVLTKRAARMRAYCIRFAAGDHYVDGAIWQMCCPHPDGLPGWGTSNNTTPFSQRARDTVRSMRGSPSEAWPLPNVWLGVSVEDQARADERIPDLLATPAAVRWLSCEPLLGPVDLTLIQFPNEHGGMECWDALDLHLDDGEPFPLEDVGATIDWVVAGGESGPGARPMHPDWARSLRDQCAAAGVPFLFKQHGESLDLEHIGERWNTMSPGERGRQQFVDGKAMVRVGKSAAGRLLDGVQHDGFPA